MYDRCACALLWWTFSAAIAQPSPAPDRLHRFDIVADVWSAAYLLHPAVPTGSIDYNRVLLDFLPVAEQAVTREEFVKAMDEQLLRPLGDSNTFIQVTTSPCATPSSAPATLSVQKLSNDTAYIDATDPRTQRERTFFDDYIKLMKNVGSVKRLIVDLRYTSEAPRTQSTWWLGVFTGGPDIAMRATYRRFFEGFNEYNDTNTVRQRWTVDSGDVLRPVRARDGQTVTAAPGGVLFLVNNTSYNGLTRALDALQKAGRAAVVLERSGCISGPDVRRYASDIEFQLNAFRLAGEPAKPDRVITSALRQDRMPELADGLLSSLTAVENPMIVVPPLKFQPYSPQLDVLGDRYQRIFWLVKVWMAIKYFFPHHEYASIDWDKSLPAAIRNIEKASNAKEFFETLREVTAPLNDSHMEVRGRDAARTRFTPPVTIGKIQGKIIVTAVKKGLTDLAPGDEVVAIDGEPIQDVEQRMRRRISASTPAAFNRRWKHQLEGLSGSTVQVTFERGGRRSTASLTRSETSPDMRQFPPSGTLRNNLGYLNPFRLYSETELEQAYRAAAETSSGLIIDMRGYPTYQDVRRFLSERLATRPMRILLQIDHLFSFESDHSFSLETDQCFPVKAISVLV